MQCERNCAIIIKLLLRHAAFPGVAKFGIALEWGSRGLEFESRHSDHNGQFHWKLAVFSMRVPGERTFSRVKIPKSPGRPSISKRLLTVLLPMTGSYQESAKLPRGYFGAFVGAAISRPPTLQISGQNHIGRIGFRCCQYAIFRHDAV